MIGRVYVVHWGDITKVGCSNQPHTRWGVFRAAARKQGVPFRSLFLSPRHYGAHVNERRILDRFRPDGVYRLNEHLPNVDPDEVDAYARTLHYPPAELLGDGPWFDYADAARVLQVTVDELDAVHTIRPLRVRTLDDGRRQFDTDGMTIAQDAIRDGLHLVAA